MTQKRIYKGNPECQTCGSKWEVGRIELSDGRVVMNIWCRRCDTLEEK